MSSKNFENPSWTKAEDEALTEAVARDLDPGQVAAFVGRSRDACIQRSLKLGLATSWQRRTHRAPPIVQTDDDGPEPEKAPAKVEDPVERRERLDETAKLRSQVDDLVRRLREANARQEFVERAALRREPPSIIPRYAADGQREMTPVVLASDWHVEEEVTSESVAGRNRYDLSIAEERIRRFFQAVVWHVEHHRASGRIAIRDLVLWLGGDHYSGFIHEELVEQNAFSPTLAVRWLIPRLRDGIATLLETLGLERIVVPCSHGNHGRTTKKTRVATGYANSFDWLMYHSLADEFRRDERVTFEITASNHQYVQVYGHWYHFTHGDEVQYQGGIGGLGIPLLKAVPMWDRVRESVVHNIGHWHMLRDYNRAIVNGSLIGFGPYSMRIRAEFEEPAQAMYYVDSKRPGAHMLTKLWVARRSEST